MLYESNFFPIGFHMFLAEWKGLPKKAENQVAHNGGAGSGEVAHNEQTSPLAKALPVQMPVPMPTPITVPPPQVSPLPLFCFLLSCGNFAIYFVTQMES